MVPGAQAQLPGVRLLAGVHRVQRPARHIQYASYPALAAASGSARLVEPFGTDANATGCGLIGCHPSIPDQNHAEREIRAARRSHRHGCCGLLNLWVVRAVPADYELVVTLTLKTGRARALYVKHESCPRWPDDIVHSDEQDDRTCAGRCALSWLVSYDTWSGEPTYATEATVAGGFGDKEPADWYIGVQALAGVNTTFELSASTRPRPEVVVPYRCGRTDAFCPGQQLTIDDVALPNPGDDLTGSTSAAARGYSRAAALLPLLAVLLHAAGGGGRGSWGSGRGRARTRRQLPVPRREGAAWLPAWEPPPAARDRHRGWAS